MSCRETIFFCSTFIIYVGHLELCLSNWTKKRIVCSCLIKPHRNWINEKQHTQTQNMRKVHTIFWVWNGIEPGALWITWKMVSWPVIHTKWMDSIDTPVSNINHIFYSGWLSHVRLLHSYSCERNCMNISHRSVLLDDLICHSIKCDDRTSINTNYKLPHSITRSHMHLAPCHLTAQFTVAIKLLL